MGSMFDDQPSARVSFQRRSLRGVRGTFISVESSQRGTNSRPSVAERGRSSAMIPMEQFDFTQQLHAYTGALIADPSNLSDDVQTSSESEDDVVVAATRTRTRRQSVDLHTEKMLAAADPIEEGARQLKEYRERQNQRKQDIEIEQKKKEEKKRQKSNRLDSAVSRILEDDDSEEEDDIPAMKTKPLRGKFVSNNNARKSLRVLGQDQFDRLNRKVVNKALTVDGVEASFLQHVTKIVDSWLLQEGETLFLDTMIDPLAVFFEKHCTSFITRYLTLCRDPQSGIHARDRSDVEEKFEKLFGYLARCEGNFCI